MAETAQTGLVGALWYQGRMRDYRTLVVWQRAHQVVLQTYRLTKDLPPDERFGLKAQMRRSGVSIASNIAEAAGRGSDPDAARLLSIAAGSTSELQYQLELSYELGLLNETVHVTLDLAHETKRMLHSLIEKWSTRAG